MVRLYQGSSAAGRKDQSAHRLVMNRDELRNRIIRSLQGQGFQTRKGKLVPPSDLDKEQLRQLHGLAVEHQAEKCKAGLVRKEENLLKWVCNGSEVSPERIRPRLVEVGPDTEAELLFRYVRLHWSIPVSAGYGRRLRFLVIDEQNDKLIGIFGLGDPVFGLGGRDQWIGWDRQCRDRLCHVMDAFVLGAVPPYSYLLGGKLVAMMTASDEVRYAFRRKYSRQDSLIDGRSFDGRLALITTTSALGRSSIYNRVGFDGRLLFQPVGFTQGSGDFHFSNGLYGAIYEYTSRYCEPTAKRAEWGTGFRNRREVIRKCLSKLGISPDWQYHGVRREIYVVPLAANTREFLRGEHERLKWHGQPADALFAWFRERWLLPRASRDARYRDFDRSSYRLWSR